jgi:hypothetical protein
MPYRINDFRPEVERLASIAGGEGSFGDGSFQEGVMRVPRMTTRRWLMAVMLIALLLATAGRWVASGCLVGLRYGSCETRLGDRAIGASSDHLLTNISLMGSKNAVQIVVEGRTVVVRGGEVTIDGTERCVIPTGCKQVEFMASGSALRVLADGNILQVFRR